jgi:hypothetical protein
VPYVAEVDSVIDLPGGINMPTEAATQHQTALLLL